MQSFFFFACPALPGDKETGVEVDMGLSVADGNSYTSPAVRWEWRLQEGVIYDGCLRGGEKRRKGK